MNINRLQELLADHRMFHDPTQIDRFIVGAPGRTTWGAYRQALRELERRYRGLKDLYIARERLRLQILRIRSPIRRVIWWRRDDRRLDIAAATLAAEDMDRSIRDTEREFRRFYAHADALRKELGVLSPKRRAALEREQWEYELTIRARFDLITAGGIHRGTLEAICALPEDVADRIYKSAREVAGLPYADPRACMITGPDPPNPGPSLAAAGMPTLSRG